MEWDARGFLAAVEEYGRPAADGGIARRLQSYSYDASGLLTGRAHRHAEYRYLRDVNGQLSRVMRIPTEEGTALGIEKDEIAFTHNAADAYWVNQR